METIHVTTSLQCLDTVNVYNAVSINDGQLSSGGYSDSWWKHLAGKVANVGTSLPCLFLRTTKPACKVFFPHFETIKDVMKKNRSFTDFFDPPDCPNVLSLAFAGPFCDLSRFPNLVVLSMPEACLGVKEVAKIGELGNLKELVVKKLTCKSSEMSTVFNLGRFQVESLELDVDQLPKEIGLKELRIEKLVTNEPVAFMYLVGMNVEKTRIAADFDTRALVSSASVEEEPKTYMADSACMIHNLFPNYKRVHLKTKSLLDRLCKL